MKRIAYTITPYTTVIRQHGVVQNPANGFPARPLVLQRRVVVALRKRFVMWVCCDSWQARIQEGNEQASGVAPLMRRCNTRSHPPDTPPLPLSSRRPSVSIGGFGLTEQGVAADFEQREGRRRMGVVAEVERLRVILEAETVPPQGSGHQRLRRSAAPAVSHRCVRCLLPRRRYRGQLGRVHADLDSPRQAGRTGG